MSFEDIAQALESYHPSPDLELVKRAYEFAHYHHRNQVRATGEPYFTHLEETALLVCRMKLDVSSVAAGLLHDSIEDCEVSRIDIEERFGSDIADIVEGVTNLTRLGASREVKQAESFRKMLVAMAKDIRVILIKLCDRLHNMRTLQHLPVEKQRIKATETKEIYAPLANRLGIHWLKSELEDLSFRYLRPQLYQELKQSFELTREERVDYMKTTTVVLKKLFGDSGVSASVRGRAKHFFSIWQKMERNNVGLDEIHDLIGFRVLVPTVRACYEALGIVHAYWKPVPGRFKDYIAMPKPNMYQSLHTTVIGPDGQRIEIQIRTPEMNRVAEEGIAAHWRYKEGGGSSTFDLQWVTELVETQQYLKNPDEFIQSVKGELFPEEVFVFTPRGDLIRLAYEATPVDFAYSIHTDVGHQATGARVNGSIVPLHHLLENGDTVEIITSKNHVPSKDWLTFVKSSKAKQRIRSFLKQEEHARSVVVGKEILSRDLRKAGHGLGRLEKEGKVLKAAEALGLRAVADLYAEVGYGKCSSERVLKKIFPEEKDLSEKLNKQSSPIRKIFEKAARVSRKKVGVRVSGVDDIVVRFARCCEPLPGDRIVGYITRGRGVTIHHADCAQVLNADPQRLVEVAWDNEVKAARRVKLTVHSQDQMGLLASVTKAITDHGGDIKSAQIKTTEYKKAVISFEIALEDARTLRKVIRNIEMVPGVIRVERVKQMDSSVELE